MGIRDDMIIIERKRLIWISFELYGQGKENIKMSAWQALKKAH
jgi:hypothetical protein